MATDWNEPVAEGGPKITKPGEYVGVIIACATTKKDGTQLVSKAKNGGAISRQLAVDFLTDDNMAYRYFCAVEGPNSWQLRGLIQAVTRETERQAMNAMGFEATQFLFSHAQQQYLNGRSCILDCTLGTDGKTIFAKPRALPEADSRATPALPPQDDDVPF